MTKSMLVLSITAITAACLAIAPDGARAGDPCSDSCDMATHAASMHMVAMQNMADMDGMTASSPAPSAPAASNATIESMQMMDDGHMEHGGHMRMTARRPASTADQQRADQILAALRTAIAPYKDYRVAEAAGYVQFHPEIPQPMYHFTNYVNAAASGFSFDPARPTSLMYKRVPGGYELMGAMYTAPAKATDDQLDQRVPLSVATWHLHTNLCIPPSGQRVAWTGPNAQFGLQGSITTAPACAAAGGTFKPVIYGWMVHVWPLETDPSKVWATEDHPGAMN